MQPRYAQEHAWDQDYAVALDMWHGQSTARATTVPLDKAINAARDGDPAAFSTLVQQYYSAAVRIAQQILLTEEAAADAVQEALIKAHRAMHRFQDGNFRSWLLRIVTNTCYDHLRRQKRRNTISLDELTEEANGETIFQVEQHSHYQTPTHAIDPNTLAERNESMEYLLAQINELPAWHRNVILLVDVHGYDYGEAAELLHVPLGTVKSRLSRARSALRDRLVGSGMLGQLAS
jgi:RNA polymerase sigma-70 factor (ECF subfamily)